MSRVIQGAELHHAPIDVPAPPAWDAVALSAYEAGFARGIAEGRTDISAMQVQLLGAIERCVDEMHLASERMTSRVLEISELFVTTVLRHLPEARTHGLLVRLGEVLRTFELEPLEVSVVPDSVADVVEALSLQPRLAGNVSVVGDPTLHPGEFHIHSEWADADGTFDRYLALARDALERLVMADAV